MFNINSPHPFAAGRQIGSPQCEDRLPHLMQVLGPPPYSPLTFLRLHPQILIFLLMNHSARTPTITTRPKARNTTIDQFRHVWFIVLAPSALRCGPLIRDFISAHHPGGSLNQGPVQYSNLPKCRYSRIEPSQCGYWVAIARMTPTTGPKDTRPECSTFVWSSLHHPLPRRR
jgi:hypothetical protein